ncbi:MAG TPA: arsenite efflux transporter metallochaperone ArsD [bacterium]|nr:arsenite efflux transporter metallochaperone ArsD [bacterium]
MNKIVFEIFDPALCCSTGVCGPNSDEKLIKMRDLIDKLKSDFGERVEIKRQSISQEPKKFLENFSVQILIKNEGKAALPVCILDGKVITYGRYPEVKEIYDYISKKMKLQ